MASKGAQSEQSASAALEFRTTHWSVVFAAAQEESSSSQDALQRLCRAYWYPLYAHVRRRGYDVQEGQDLTQGFFERLLEKSFLRAVDRKKGKFRTFLLTALDHFLANEWRRGQTRKRGGGQTFISLDEHHGESRYQLEPAHDETPARLFERRWALALLDQAMARLGEECRTADKGKLFDTLKSLIGGDRAELQQLQLAAQLGLTQNALNLALLRLRQRYGELIREEIAATVADPNEVDDELRFLVAAVRE